MHVISTQQMQSIQGGIVTLTMLASSAAAMAARLLIGMVAVGVTSYGLYRGIKDVLDEHHQIDIADNQIGTDMYDTAPQP